jgi:hypothetical protein
VNKGSKYHIAVSAENCSYMAWQSRLFYYSCVTHLGLRPIFIVHDLEPEWHPYYLDVVAAGGIVRSAPSYRKTRNGDDYSPRNTAGTLLQAAEIGYSRNDFIVVCDPDMIFLRRLTLPQTLAAEGCSNLNYDKREVRRAARRLGISSDLLDRRKKEVECSVPHVIPVSQARRLAEVWLEAIDAFRPGEWQISMYAFGLAVIKLGLELRLTNQVALNDEQYVDVGDAAVIHYSYGDRTWNKRHYWTREQAPRVWQPTIQFPRRTILGEIISQIDEAGAFYRKKLAGQLL